MGGIDFGPLMQVINLLIKMLADILGLIDLKVAVVGLTATEIAKKWLPDRIEDKWIPIISIIICGLVSLIPKFNTDVVTGIITGCFITGGYALLISFIKKIIVAIFKLKNGGIENGQQGTGDKGNQ